MKKFLGANNGVTAIEYGLIVAIIFVCIAAVVTLDGERVSGVFNKSHAAFVNASLGGYTGPGYGIAPPPPGNLHYGSDTGVTVDVDENSYGCHPINSPTAAIYSGNQLYSVKMLCNNTGTPDELVATAYKSGFIIQAQNGQIPAEFGNICGFIGAYGIGAPFGAAGNLKANTPAAGRYSVVGNQYICNYD